MIGSAFLVFFGIPIALALLLGFLFPQRFASMGLASVGAFAALLFVVNAKHGVLVMLPFTAIVSGIVAIPAIVAALVGAAVRDKITEKR